LSAVLNEDKKRNKLEKYLKRKRIETVVHYPQPLHLTKTYKYLGYKKGDFPNSEKVCSEVLSLPINPVLSEGEIGHVIKMTKNSNKWKKINQYPH